MAGIIKQKIWLIFIFTSSISFAQIRPNTAIFFIPQVDQTKKNVNINTNSIPIVTNVDDEYTIKFPIKKDDGTYELIEVTYFENDTTRTISIPGQGDINLIKDESGNYNFTLTPEQIKDSSNVNCSVGLKGTGTCTIEPFVTMVGNKILSSDKLVVDYTEGENLVVAGGTATNLKLTEPGATTDVAKSTTEAGDSTVQIKFTKQEEASSPKVINVGGMTIPVPNTPGIALTPQTIQSSKNMEISLNTSMLTHSVTNPNNPSQSAVKFKVNDAGVSSRLLIDNQDHLKIEFDAQTGGGVTYNSNPFSEKTLKIDSTAPVKASFRADNDPLNPKATLHLETSKFDNNNNLAVLNVQDTRDDKSKKSITSYGQTVVNLSQATAVDEKTYKPVDDKAPVAFEVGSDHIIVKQEKKDGKTTTSEIKGLVATGVYDPKTKFVTGQATADFVSIKKPKSEIEATNLKYAMSETSSEKKQEAMLDHAYYNNGETKLNLSGGAFVSLNEYKNEETAEKFDGKSIKKDTVIIGNSAQIDNSGAKASISGGVSIRELRFYDDTKITSLAGNSGGFVNKDYQLGIADGFSAVNYQDAKGNSTYTKVSATTISGTKKNDVIKVLNSETSGEVIGKTQSGKDIIEINHTSRGIEYKTVDGKRLGNVNDLSVKVVDADKVKYGTAKFSNLKIFDNKKGNNQTLEIKDAELAVYTDESDPTRKIRQGELSLHELGAKTIDYSVNVVAKDADGKQTKYKIFVNEVGSSKNYKIFAEDGSRVFIDGVDKDNRHASVLFEAIEYMEDDQFKSLMAKNVSGNLKTVSNDSTKLQSFNIARVDGVQSLDGNFKQFILTDGSLSQVIPGKEDVTFKFAGASGTQTKQDGITSTSAVLTNGKIDFKKLDSSNTKANLTFGTIAGFQSKNQNGAKESFILGQNISGTASNKNSDAQVDNLNLSFVESEKVKYGQADFKNLIIKNNKDGKNQTLEIKDATAAVYVDESDPTNKIKQGQMSLNSLDAKGIDYSVNVIAKDVSGASTNYKIFFSETGSSKNYKIFAEDGSRIYLDGADKNNRHAKVLFEAIDYMEDDKFKSVMAKNISGTLETITPDSSKLQSFNVARIEGAQSIDPFGDKQSQGQFSNLSATQTVQGKDSTSATISSGVFAQNKNTTQASLTSGKVDYQKFTDKKTNATVTFDHIEGSQTKDGTNKETYIKATGLSGSASEVNKNISFGGLNAQGFQSKEVKYGEVNFDNLKVEEVKNGKKESFEILGAQAAFYEDEKTKQADASLSQISAKSVDYSVDVIAKDTAGNAAKYKVMLFEQDGLKQYKIFGEDGARVDISGKDKDNNHAKILFDSIEYLQDNKFKQILVENVSANYETLKPNDKKLYSFSSSKIEGLEALDGSSRLVDAQNFGVGLKDNLKSDASFKADRLTFSEQNYLDTKDLKIQALAGVVNYAEYKDPKKGSVSGAKLEGKLSFGSFIANQITKPNNDKITLVSAKDLDIVAIDYNEMVKLNGKVGGVDYFKDSSIQTIQLSDLKNFNLEDMKSGMNASFDAKKILRVVNKDANGKETGSYLLVNSAFLSAKDPTNGINANVKVGVLEVFQDKVNKQNIILDADISGKINIDKTKSPIKAEASFAFKGKHLTTESHKFVSNDGNTVSNYFAIKPVDEKGRLDHLKLSAGPSFLKDAISLEAKGGANGGKTLSFTFEQDKAKGTYYVRAEFKEGEKVKVKLFPFTLESKMEGADAVAEILLTPKGQNFMNHMEIISNVVSENEITSWLGISNGGMIVARTGTLGGFGFEMMYQNEDFFDPGDVQPGIGNKDKAQTFGAGIFHKNDKGDKTSLGVMLSGDSEIAYQTNGRGVLKIFGVDMDKSGSIPSTINLYLKKNYADGDSIYGGVFVDAASLLVDEKKLSKSSAFYDGNRGLGKVGASMAYSKRIDDTSRLTLAVGLNDNFSKPAVCLTYTKTFGGSTPSRKALDLSKDTMRVVNKYSESMAVSRSPAYSAGPSIQGAISLLDSEVKNLEIKYEESKTLDKAKEALKKTLEAIDNKTLTVQNADRLFNLTQEDIEIIRRIEAKNHKSTNIARQLEDITHLVRYDVALRVGVGRVYDEAKKIRSSMEQITKEYHESETSELFDQYSAKLSELSKIGG